MAPLQNLSDPVISVIVIVYDMLREAPRTLQSLTPKYQNVCEEKYEVIVVDNGSPEPFSKVFIEKFGKNFKYFYIKDASPSPAAAINFGVSQASGEVVGILIDGARILSPGIVNYALLAFKAYEDPFVTTLGWHLGTDIQTRSTEKGYNQVVEDNLIQSIEWPSNGYRLFEISAFAGSSQDGWFLPIAESSCFFIRKSTYEKLNGFDERFDERGGGLVNLDFYKRACELSDIKLVILIGEGTFHQVHGGVSTNVTEIENRNCWLDFEKQYIAIRGEKFSRPAKKPDFLGSVSTESLQSVLFSADLALKRYKGTETNSVLKENFLRIILKKIYKYFATF